jgi:hypothetical protein
MDDLIGWVEWKEVKSEEGWFTYSSKITKAFEDGSKVGI